MSKLAVKYDNDLNTIPFRNFNSVELDLFFSICANLKEKGTNKVTYNFDKLKEISKYEHRSVSRFVNDLDSTYQKLLNLDVKLENKSKLIRFNLFNYYEIDKDNQTVEIAVNEHFDYILNDLNIGNYTRFELKEFTSLKSTYSKAIYRLLKQYKSTGLWRVSVVEFRRLLSVPDSYRMSDLDKVILVPALKDLTPYFKGLNLKKIKAKKGNRIEYFEFRFKRQNDKKEWLESKERKPKENEFFYGKYNNVYLSDDEVHTIIFDWHMKYLIEELSDWKYKTNPKTRKSDFELIKAFKAKKQKDQAQNILDLYK